MDNFDSYMTMCIEDKDIQPLWKPIVGHKFIQKIALYKSELPTIYTVINMTVLTEEIKKDLIWLPFQEDLQNILNYSNYNLLLEDLLNFIYKGPGEINLQMSGNETLFAFAKFKLFNKKWHTNQWISL